MPRNVLRIRLRRFVITAGVGLTACADNATAPDRQVEEVLLAKPTGSAQCDADNGGLTLPPGFCAVVVVKGVGRARHMAVRPNGDLYVAINNGPGATVGAVLALRDTDGRWSSRRADALRSDGGERRCLG
jgi:hypothetical protein